MSIGSQRRRASAIRHEQSTDGLLLLPRKGSAVTSLSLPAENSVFIDELSDMPYDTQLTLSKKKRSTTSIVMERSKQIGEKVSEFKRLLTKFLAKF